MARIILTRGLPGSGKSTWAREVCDKEPGRWKLVDKDSLRQLLDNSKWSKTNEKFVLKIRDHIVSEALADGLNVIVHDTNFESVHQDRLRELAKGHQFEIKDFDTPLDECIQRDLKRFDSVGEAVIRKMHDKYLAKPVEPPTWVEGAPKAIIVDLDGTLAHFTDRSPYDASTCEDDICNSSVSNLIHNYGEDGGDIILCSGREDKYREQTERWLVKHCIEYDQLFMRKAGDMRKDSTVKREIFEQWIRSNWNIEYVVDDRKQVVDMWRNELGLVCWQVAPGEF